MLKQTQHSPSFTTDLGLLYYFTNIDKIARQIVWAAGVRFTIATREQQEKALDHITLAAALRWVP